MTSQAKPAKSVLEMLDEHASRFRDHVALKGREDNELTYAQLSSRSRSLASFLIESGVKRGDKIAILSESRPEWAVALFAAVRCGATTVPLDIKLTKSELVSILSDCRPVALFTDTRHRELANELPASIDSLRGIYLVDWNRGDSLNPSIDQLIPESSVPGIERFTDEIALIVYTSGTTGSPKGVMTTFSNLIFQISSFEAMVHLSDKDRFLSILPLNHLLELTGGFLGVLSQGGTVCFCHSLFPQEIIRCMRDELITGMVGVPLFFKSLKSGIEREVKKQGPEALARFQAGLEKAGALPMEQRRQMFLPVLTQLGGHLRVLISGGAPLDVEVAHFFERLGIPVLEGYGLTETSPVISGNSLNANKVGSVGQPLPGVEVQIQRQSDTDSEGEILTRGPHVMAGYHGREDLTHEAIDENGWLHTGDLGHQDDDGFLYITGRIKNMIVLGGGKKIFPEEVEAALSRTASVKELCVVGTRATEGFKEGTEEVCLVVVPSDDVVKSAGGDEKELQQVLKGEFDRLAEDLAPYKRPTKMVISMSELPKTATRKVKRPEVLRWLSEKNL